MLWIDQIAETFRQLMPTGRAFKGPMNGYLHKLNRALAIGENYAFKSAIRIYNDMLLDSAAQITARFITDAIVGGTDASDWERRLGLIDLSSLPLSQMSTRVNLILQQFNYPGITLPRGNKDFVQAQLRLAGFDVTIYENRFFNGTNWYAVNPLSLVGGGGANNQHGDFQHGDGVHGGVFPQLVVNSLDNATDLRFYVSPNYYSTFFIGGPTLGSYAYIPAALEQQFRQLILKLKPAQTVGYLFIVYV